RLNFREWMERPARQPLRRLVSLPMGGRVSVTCAEFANSGTDQSSDNNDEVSEIDRIVAKFLSLCLLIPLRGVTRPVGRPASPVVEFYSSKWPLPPSLPLARKQ